MRHSLFAIIAALIVSGAVADSGRPSWFPKVSCKDAWKQALPQNLHHYDFKTYGSTPDGYARYSKELNRYSKVPSRRDCYKDWSVLVVMEPTKDLAPYALWDLTEMEAAFQSQKLAGSTIKTDVLVHLNMPSMGDVLRLHMFQTDEAFDARRGLEFFERKDASLIQSPRVMRLKEDARSRLRDRLESFLSWGLTEYPALHTMVVLWGHGQGWNESDSFGRMGVISLPDLRDGLKNVVQKTLEGRPIDVYASDACLMQMAEVAAEIAPSARYIVGSAQVQSYLGMPYRTLLYELNSGRFRGLKAGEGRSADETWLMARMIPLLMKASLSPGGNQRRHDAKSAEAITMTSLNSYVLVRKLVPSLHRLAATLTSLVDEDPLWAGSVQAVIQKVPEFEGNAQDLGVFLWMLQSLLAESDSSPVALVGQARKQLNESLDALNEMIVSQARGTLYENERMTQLGFKGISIWLPPTKSEFEARQLEFLATRFFQSEVVGLGRGAWGRFLKKLFYPFGDH